MFGRLKIADQKSVTIFCADSLRDAFTPAIGAGVCYFSATPFPAAISLSRAICVQVRRRTAVMATPPRRASSSS